MNRYSTCWQVWSAVIDRRVLMLRSLACLIVLAAASVIVAPARSDVLAVYSFTGQSAPGNVAAGGVALPEIVNSGFLSSASAIDTILDDEDTGVQLRYRTSLSGSGGNRPGANAQVPTLEGRVTSPDLGGALGDANAIDPNKYFFFKLTANTAFDLADLTFDMAKGSSSDFRGTGVQYSVDNDAVSFNNPSALAIFNVADDEPTDMFSPFSLDLEDTSVSSGQTVTFRFYPFVTTGLTGGVRFDNFVVSEGIGLIPGDVNGDGDVDDEDFGIIRMNFGNTGMTRSQGDLSLDGIVDFADFRLWKNNVTSGTGSGTSDAETSFESLVPEPASLVSLIVSIAGLSLARGGRTGQRGRLSA